MIKINLDQALHLHKIMAEETGGDAGVREPALLDSALNTAYQTFGGVELYPSIEEKGARLAFSLIANHPFIDGNKRIGIYVMLVFLEANGVFVDPPEEEVVRVGLAVASSLMTYDDLLGWIIKYKK